MYLKEILNGLEKVRKSGKGYSALCPAHDDKNNSLSITEKSDKILIHCHAGCKIQNILKALNLDFNDLFIDTKSESKILECEYIYKNAEGKNLYKVMRYKNPKTFKQAKFENGKWIYTMKDVQYVPYNLVEVLKSDIVYWVEGEKDVENLKEIDLIATTTCSGANGFNKKSEDYIKYFKDKKVYIIPDNDEAGHKYANEVYDKLKDVVSYIGVLNLKNQIPDLKKGGDISDVLQLYGKEKTLSIINKMIEYENENKIIYEILDKLKRIKPEYKYSKDNLGDAQMFHDIFLNKIIYDVTCQEWRYYDGISWALDTKSLTINKLFKYLKCALDIYVSDVTDESFKLHIKSLGSKNVRDLVIKDAKDISFVKSDAFDNDKFLLNCQNGTLDLKNCTFRKHDAKDMISKVANVKYNPQASYKLFEETLKIIFDSNLEKLKFVQKVIGYSLTGATNEEKAFILLGLKTRNGKSTLVETISLLLGDYSITSQPEILAQKAYKDSKQASGDIARLKGARFLTISEPSENMILDVALVKTLTGNDKIVARELYSKEIEFYPQFKIFINTNHLPLINDETIFDSNRLILITFNHHFTESEQNKNLKDILKKEENLSGILNWCLEGLKNYQKEGLNPPQCVIDDILQYKKSSNKFEQFIDDCLIDSEENCKVTDVYNRYLEWTESNKIGAESKSSIIQKLNKRGMIKASGKIKEFKDGKIISNTYKNIVYHKKIV